MYRISTITRPAIRVCWRNEGTFEKSWICNTEEINCILLHKWTEGSIVWANAWRLMQYMKTAPHGNAFPFTDRYFDGCTNYRWIPFTEVQECGPLFIWLLLACITFQWKVEFHVIEDALTLMWHHCYWCDLAYPICMAHTYSICGHMCGHACVCQCA